MLENYDEEGEIIENDYYGIEFQGFLDFAITFNHNSIYFSDPPYRYKTWFECENEIRDEWRKYMYQVIKLFGGDRVIYLPDQRADEFLDIFDQIPPLTFEEVENEIIKEYSKDKYERGKIILGNFIPEQSIWYFIDNFNDLELLNKLSLEEYKKWYNRS